MSISIVQALILGIFASLSSMPGMGSSSIGNYTLGRPLVGRYDSLGKIQYSRAGHVFVGNARAR